MKPLLMLLFVGISLNALAQGEHSIEINHFSDHFRSPGLSLRYQKSIYHAKKIKTNGKSIDKMISLGIRYSWYKRNNHHNAHVLSPYIRFERKNPRQIILQTEVGLGYFNRKQLNHTFNIIDEKLEQKRVTLHRLYPQLYIGIGYDFESWIKVPVQLIFRPGIAYEMPNNASGLVHMYAEFGIRYCLRK